MIISFLKNRTNYESGDRLVVAGDEIAPNETETIASGNDFFRYTSNLSATLHGIFAESQTNFNQVRIKAETPEEITKNYGKENTYWFVTDDEQKVQSNNTIKNLTLDVVRTFWNEVAPLFKNERVEIKRKHIDRFRANGTVNIAGGVFDINEFQTNEKVNDTVFYENYSFTSNDLWDGATTTKDDNVLFGIFDLTKTTNYTAENYYYNFEQGVTFGDEIPALQNNYITAPVLSKNEYASYPNHIKNLNDNKTLAVYALPFWPTRNSRPNLFPVFYTDLAQNRFSNNTRNLTNDFYVERGKLMSDIPNFPRYPKTPEEIMSGNFNNDIELFSQLYTFELFVNNNFKETWAVSPKQLFSNAIFKLIPLINEVIYRVEFSGSADNVYPNKIFETTDAPLINLENDQYKSYLANNSNSLAATKFQNGLALVGSIGALFAAPFSGGLSAVAGVSGAVGAARSIGQINATQAKLDDLKQQNSSIIGSTNTYASDFGSLFTNKNRIGFNLKMNLSSPFAVNQVATFFRKFGNKIDSIQLIPDSNTWWKTRKYWNYWEIEGTSHVLQKTNLSQSIVNELIEQLKNGIRFFADNADLDYSKNNYELILE